MQTFAGSRTVSLRFADGNYFYEMCLFLTITEEKHHTQHQALDMKDCRPFIFIYEIVNNKGNTMFVCLFVYKYTYIFSIYYITIVFLVPTLSLHTFFFNPQDVSSSTA